MPATGRSSSRTVSILWKGSCAPSLLTFCPLARILRGLSTSNHDFRTCLANNENGQSGWVPLNCLYRVKSNRYAKCEEESTSISHDEMGIRNANTPNQLLFIARKGLKCQIFDTKLWHDVYQRSVDLRDNFIPRQWVELLHIYKRIKVNFPILMNMASNELLYQLERLTLEDLSKLTLSLAYHQFCHYAMFNRIASVITTRLRHQHMEVSNEDNATTFVTAKKAHPLSKITSYTHLLGGFAKCNFPHKELFEAVASELQHHMASADILIPPGFLMKIFTSYFRFGYRHNELFDVLCKEFVTAKLSIDELQQLQNMMNALEYENDLMLNVFAYRLGNADVARFSRSVLTSQ